VSTTKEVTGAVRDYKIPANSPWAGAWKIFGILGIAGLAAAAYGYTLDAQRFAFAYLFGLWVPLGLAIGSLFFVMVLYITKASWGITVRRVAELFMRPMPIFAILVIPLVLLLPQMFPWLGAKTHITEAQFPAATSAAPASPEASEGPLAEARGDQNREPAALRDLPVAHPKQMEHAEEHEEHEVIEHKSFYLNKKFFLGRLIFYLLVWSWLAQKYFRWSTEQDKTKAAENTVAAQGFAPAGLMLFAVTITFFGFDWFLSLSSTWYSTIFGVQLFAQAALFQMACLVLVTLGLRRSGILGDAVNVEHFHDMGKLLFGWIVFWGYISFAQFFLTWYSNIPDEVVWFHQRWNDNGGTWKNLSIGLVIFYFFVPFWFLMSRNIKRRLPLLAIGAGIVAVMHVVEVYWLILPSYGPLAPSWLDAACLVGLSGIYLASVLRGMEDHSLVAVGDPRLERALEFENA
jgi:MFS family permease